MKKPRRSAWDKIGDHASGAGRGRVVCVPQSYTATTARHWSWSQAYRRLLASPKSIRTS